MKGVSKRFLAGLAAVAAASLLLGSCAANPQKAKLKYYQKGQEYMKKAQYSSAAIEFKNALQVDPKYVDAYYQLARANMGMAGIAARAGQDATPYGQDAFKALQTALQIEPNRVDARLARAQLYLGAGAKYRQQAEEDANFVIKQDPKNADAHEILGSALTQDKKYDQALQEFTTVSQLRPGKAQPYLDIALVDLALHNLPDTEQNLKKAISVDPKTPQAFIDLGNFYRLEKKLPEAEQAFQQGLQENPGDIAISMDWAVTLTSEGKEKDAEGVLSQLESQAPKSVDAAIAIGDFYLQTKKVTQALAEYRRGLSIDPRNLLVQKRIEDLYLTTGQNDLAAQMDATSMKEAPDDTIAQVDHGRLLLAQGKTQDAVNYLQKVVADAPDSPEAHYYLASAEMQNGNLGQANTELQNTLKLSPGGSPLPIALKSLAELNLSQNNLSVAQIYAQELVQKNEGDPSYRLLLGEIFLREGQNKSAEEQFTSAEQLTPNDPAVHLSLGQFYAVSKNLPQAESEYQKALDLAPQNADVLNQYANFLVIRGERPKAASIVQQFVQNNPANPRGHLILGSFHIGDKNYAAAKSETEQALQLDPKMFDAYLQLGQIYRDQGDNNDAVQMYEKYLGVQPKSAPVMTVVGSIYQDEGDLPKAVQSFEQALAVDPNFSVAANNLAWIYAQQGTNLDRALGLAQQARSQNPDQLSYADTLGWVMYKRGDYPGALPLFQDCVKKAPQDAQFRFHLGMDLVAAGQKQKGKEALQAALQMKLDDADAQQARQALSSNN